ncbi:MAG: hypothetical protein LUQ56_09245 [Methylococcaceae bacterium]|nr:hypothetical protein [Methylococcaceae bacterium]
MVNQNSNAQDSNIIESMNQAFDNGNSYGLEYVLDELVSENSTPANQNTVDWFGATDYFA